MYTLLCYNKCSTCMKAIKYLNNLDIKYEIRDIKTNNPSKDELEMLIRKSNLDINKFFNTSGAKYRELNLKENLKNMSYDEKLDLLASDGMIIKRPILYNDDIVIVGKKEDEYDRLG